MGDASDGTYTDICEVCHTQTSFFRNDASALEKDHFNGEQCTYCHVHGKGLLEPAGLGGEDCSLCHDNLLVEMDRVTPAYRHLVADSSPDYPTFPVTMRCVACHGDHDIFDPLENPLGGRGANLRTDILVVPDPSSGFTNTDFEN